jgi:hypothetical protein
MISAIDIIAPPTVRSTYGRELAIFESFHEEVLAERQSAPRPMPGLGPTGNYSIELEFAIYVGFLLFDVGRSINRGGRHRGRLRLASR